MPRIRFLVASGVVLLACFPKDSQFGGSTTKDNTSESGGVPDACGDAQVVPGVYCFDIKYLDSVLVPAAAVSAQFTGAPPERFAVFAMGDPDIMVWWEDGELKSEANVPSLSLAAYDRVLAVDVMGSSQPDLVYTGLLEAGVALNEGGLLKPYVPIGIPPSESGHTIPIDISGDGTIEYLKGEGNLVKVWSKMADEWKPNASEFEVPGCGVLADFSSGDFNGDGLADVAYIGTTISDSTAVAIACADPATHGVMVLLQTEVGSLQMMPILSTGQHKFRKVMVENFDGDNFADVSVQSEDEELLIFRSSGDGQFENPKIVKGVYAYTVGDVDGDLSAECVVSARTRAVTVVDDVFGSLKSTMLAGASGLPLTVGDLNDDGVGDVAFVSTTVEKNLVLTVAVSNP